MLRKRVVIGLASGALAAVVAGGSAWAAVTSNPPPSTSYTGCLTSASGSIYNVKQGAAPVAACTAGDKQIKLSGGDITGVTAGSGLTGGAAKGAATLALDPAYQLPQSCGSGAVPTSTGAGTWACGSAIPSQRFNLRIPSGASDAPSPLGGLQFGLDCGNTDATVDVSATGSGGNFNMLYGILDGGNVQDAGFAVNSLQTEAAADDVGGTGTYVWDDENGDVVTGTITWYDPGTDGSCQFAGDMVEAGS